MNIILQMVHNKVMGSVIDAIEYFLVSYKSNKSIKLVFIEWLNYNVNNYKSVIVEIIKTRYADINIDCFNSIHIIKKNDLVSYKFDKILILDWGTIQHIKGLLRAKKIIIISELHTENKEFFLPHNKYPVIYYGEMPFIYRDVDYKMKFAFNLYPEIQNDVDSKNYIYVNSPNNVNIENDENILNIANNRKIIKKSPKHINNFMGKFDTYLYHHANKYFDPHPRLFHECYFYNKNILYENPCNIRDGSYYRYHDLMKNGLQGRYLDESDEIIQALI